MTDNGIYGNMRYIINKAFWYARIRRKGLSHDESVID